LQLLLAVHTQSNFVWLSLAPFCFYEIQNSNPINVWQQSAHFVCRFRYNPLKALPGLACGIIWTAFELLFNGENFIRSRAHQRRQNVHIPSYKRMRIWCLERKWEQERDRKRFVGYFKIDAVNVEHFNYCLLLKNCRKFNFKCLRRDMFEKFQNVRYFATKYLSWIEMCDNFSHMKGKF
jgi:hypothetical protein